MLDPDEWNERQCLLVLSDSKKSKFWKWHAAKRLVLINAPPSEPSEPSEPSD
jgi:hypothetical protein